MLPFTILKFHSSVVSEYSDTYANPSFEAKKYLITLKDFSYLLLMSWVLFQATIRFCAVAICRAIAKTTSIFMLI